MRLATVKQSQEIEEISRKVYHLTGEILMESAGSLAAREIDQSFFPELSRGLLSVVCGPGNNGGDGLVVARHLHSAGHRNMMVFTMSPTNARSELFKLQLKRAELQGIKIIDLLKTPEKIEQLRSSELVVDALFGIGLSRPISGNFTKVVDLINSVDAPVVSLDCPSGLNCDTGVAEGAVVQAMMTLTFGLAKPGFFVADGPHHVGKLRVLPIGFPYECLRENATTHFSFSEKLARRYLPVRRDRTNKSDYGHVLVIAGHEGMWGAGVLASTSAYRMGAGYVTWASWQAPSDQIKEIPEVLTMDVFSALEKNKYSAIVIGPGLGVSKDVAKVIEILKKKKIPVVVDADAITVCAQNKLWPLPSNWVLTPHAKELSRILGCEVDEIEKDRFSFSQKASKKTGAHVLLKGYRSVLADKERILIIPAGNSALAKAGTGDVLSGMIGGLLAQGLETVQAVATAAYIHGRVSDEFVRIGNNKGSLSASDIKDHLPELMGRLQGGTLL